MKIDSPELRGQSQELIDVIDKIIEIINYGKVQKQVVSAVPTWKGRQGDEVYVIQGNSGWLYMCAVDDSTTWKQVQYFSIA